MEYARAAHQEANRPTVSRLWMPRRIFKSLSIGAYHHVESLTKVFQRIRVATAHFTPLHTHQPLSLPPYGIFCLFQTTLKQPSRRKISIPLCCPQPHNPSLILSTGSFPRGAHEQAKSPGPTTASRAQRYPCLTNSAILVQIDKGNRNTKVRRSSLCFFKATNYLFFGRFRHKASIISTTHKRKIVYVGPCSLKNNPSLRLYGTIHA